MKNKILIAIFTIGLIAPAISKAEDWNTTYKQYSQNLYQQGMKREAEQLARWFKARQNQRNGSALDAKQIMNLHYKNDIELRGRY
jgi:hypothetical protein